MKEYTNEGEVLLINETSKETLINKIKYYCEDYEVVKNRKNSFINIPSSFDIETTSFYNNYVDNEKHLKEKCAIMYEWTFGINGLIIIGRKWDEFLTLCEYLNKIFCLSTDKQLIVYVHNLAFEFQFIRKFFIWEKVFAVEDRKPVSALTDSGICFKCSYILSGYGLETLANNLHKYKIKKLVGDLDYSLIRHEETPLTEKELGYCINDVKIVMSYIKELIEDYKSIALLPLTKTGFVRRYCQNYVLYGDKKGKDKNGEYLKNSNFIHNLTIEPKEYEMLKRAFQGGFTHANPSASGLTFENVASYDFTSSYPAVMCSEEAFPMSKGKLVTIKNKEDLEFHLQNYCCLFDIKLYGVTSKYYNEHYLSVSRCYGLGKHIEDNGRIVEADELITTITEQDYYILKYVYNWEEMKIGDFYVYKRDYLPKNFILSILKLYQDKTELKNVEGKENEYQHSKEYINSAYGMAVTDICRPSIIYNGMWSNEEVDIEEALDQYNYNKSRFLSYAWGVWVTALARSNLWSAIIRIQNDYLYSDTDSVKILNHEKYKPYFDNYNNNIKDKLLRMCKHYGIDEKLVHPKTIEGDEKWLGVWDYEGEYQKFKCLGAKRYITLKKDKLSFTISGVNKKEGVPYLLKKYKNDIDKIFNEFKEDMLFPAEATGKQTHSYIDYMISGYITDYLGNTIHFEAPSGVHLEGCEYYLGISEMYKQFLQCLKERRETYI